MMNMVETTQVTGATGTVGSEVVKQLLASSPSSPSSDHNLIKAAVHSQNKADKVKQDNKEVEIVNIDYNKAETIADALINVDKLFLLIDPVPNISISSNVVKEAKKNGVKCIVMLSSLAVDVEPRITIGRLHRQEEKIIEESGIPYTFLRPNAFMQNFVNFFGHTIKTQKMHFTFQQETERLALSMLEILQL
jgi:uncharacterized protein YbjT (DUF2867 family)